MLPDYMVHRPNKPKSADSVAICPPAPSGVPYRNPLITERDGTIIFLRTKLPFIALKCVQTG